MNAKLQSTFDALESQRSRLLNELRSLPLDVLTSTPAAKWSILMILSHIIAAEQMGLNYVHKKILGVKEVGTSGLWEESKLLTFLVSQRIPMLKYKAPRVIVENTVSYTDLRTIEKEWEKLRAEWRLFLEALPEQYTNRKIFRHAVGGRFDVRQGLIVFREHINHHLPQIRGRMKTVR